MTLGILHRWGLCLALGCAAFAKVEAAPPLDAHLFAENVAGELTALVKPGAALQVEVPNSYFELAVVAQLRARGFTVVDAGVGGGMPVHYSLIDAGNGKSIRISLVVALDALTRSYDASTGKPTAEWRKVQPVVARP